MKQLPAASKVWSSNFEPQTVLKRSSFLVMYWIQCKHRIGWKGGEGSVIFSSGIFYSIETEKVFNESFLWKKNTSIGIFLLKPWNFHDEGLQEAYLNDLNGNLPRIIKKQKDCFERDNFKSASCPHPNDGERWRTMANDGEFGKLNYQGVIKRQFESRSF